MNRLAVLFLLMAACYSTPIETRQTDNTDVNVAKLFHVDGCTVYRFRDGLYEHYFARCSTNTSSETSVSRSCGKNCTRREADVVMEQDQ